MIISADPIKPDSEEGAEIVADTERRDFAIDKALHGSRLDQAMAALVPEFSRSYLRQLIDAGCVEVDGKATSKPAQRMRAGQRGCIELRPTPQSQAFRAEQIDFPIVFQDEHLLVVNKPAGLVVHPAPGNWSGTLLNGLLALDAIASTLPRAGIVHRLDKNTSGLMVVARSRQVMDALVKMIASREVNRHYLAVTAKTWPGPNTRDVEAPIGRDPRNRLRMAVVDTARDVGKPAKTTFELMQSSAAASLVKCTLHTGRTHQIRVHMASIGCPLIDDELYGGALIANPGRPALHASRLSFEHPVTLQPMRFHVPLPGDLVALLVRCGLSYNEV